MNHLICPECTGPLELKVVRALTKGDANLFELISFDLYLCRKCGATFVPKDQDMQVRQDQIAAASPAALFDILIKDMQAKSSGSRPG